MNELAKRQHKYGFFFDFFQSYWLTRISKRNIADEVMSEITTANALESFHHQLRIKLVYPHMNILSFFRYLYELDDDKSLKKWFEVSHATRSEPLAILRAEAT